MPVSGHIILTALYNQPIPQVEEKRFSNQLIHKLDDLTNRGL